MKSTACFKCGQTGHWAKSCTQTNNNMNGELGQLCSSTPDKLNTTNSLVVLRPEVRMYKNTYVLNIFYIHIQGGCWGI